jgi:hypothetical protein
MRVLRIPFVLQLPPEVSSAGIRKKTDKRLRTTVAVPLGDTHKRE